MHGSCRMNLRLKLFQIPNIFMIKRCFSMESLLHRICVGDRSALSRALTLVESSKEEHQKDAENIMNEINSAKYLTKKR